MTNQARTSRVLIALIVSMTIGAVVLMALDNGGLLGGAWSLSVHQRLNRLNPIEPLVSGAADSSGCPQIHVLYNPEDRTSYRPRARNAVLQSKNDNDLPHPRTQ